MKTRLMHLSVGAQHPKAAAELLAAFTGGEVQPFHPVDGGFVCLWGGWEGQFVEFYPKGTEVYRSESGARFRQKAPAGGNPVHLNLFAEGDTKSVVALAKKLGVPYHFRPGNGGPLHEVWIEDDFLLELVTPDL